MNVRFLLGLTMLLCWSQLSLAKVYLVSVGIADYPGTANDLRISGNDPKTIAKIFKATGDATTVVLVNQKATQQGVLDKMGETFAGAKADDTVILYFSGHGAPGALCCYDGMLDYQHVFDQLATCQATSKMIFVDACFSGKMRTPKRQANRFNAQNVMLFLSSRTNETSMETGYQNSMFTLYLERGLRGGADTNKDRTVTARELYEFVHDGVIERSQDRQHPVMWGKFDNDMPVIKW